MEIFDGLFRFCEIFGQFFGISKDFACFLAGGGCILFIGLIGWVAFRAGVWRSTRNAAYEPQTAFTTQTPHQVMRASRQASIRLLLMWLLVLSPIICLLVYILTNASEQENTVTQILNGLLYSLRSP